MSNIETVRGIYEAFDKDNLAGILGRLAEDVEWDYGYPDRGIPWLAPRRGRDGARAFFTATNAMEIKRFAAKAVIGSGSLVVAISSMTTTALSLHASEDPPV